MIINIPAADKIDAEAHRLYFKVWDGVSGIIEDYQGVLEEDRSFNETYASLGPDGETFVSDNSQEYLERAQIELHSLSAILQQSLELALKARICGESPYLLLLNAEVRFSKDGDLDFSTLRTIDAVDLPAAVNSLTARPVSENFIRLYGDLRLRRNLYMHLGVESKDAIDPRELRSRLIDLYVEIWPETMWLNDYLVTKYADPETFRFDGKQLSVERLALFQANELFGWLTKG